MEFRKQYFFGIVFLSVTTGENPLGRGEVNTDNEIVHVLYYKLSQHYLQILGIEKVRVSHFREKALFSMFIEAF